ncbi:MAG: hypothetical protein PHE84_13295 [bacterium]|nr:hypothetical protein [bacterium]
MNTFKWFLAVFTALGIALGSSCGSGSGSGTYTGGDLTGVVSNNHGHVAMLTQAQIEAGAAVTLDIQGTATHSHTLDLSATQMTDIKDGTQVAQESSVSLGHSHLVTFN